MIRPIVASLILLAVLGSCRPKNEKVDVFVNESDNTVTITHRGFNTAQGIPNVVLEPGESAVLRQFLEREKEWVACPHDIGFLQDRQIDLGDTIIPLLDAIDTIGWERKEEDLIGIGSGAKFICECHYK